MDGLSSIPWAYLGLAFAMSLAISAMGFRRVDYFVSLGYAFSIVAQALVFPFLYPAGLDVWTVLVDALYLAYGLRLGLFLLQRERAPSFAREQKASLERGMREHLAEIDAELKGVTDRILTMIGGLTQ